MLNAINPKKTKSWDKLSEHFSSVSKTSISELFQQDKNRFDKFSIRFEDILFDYSKNNITEATIKLFADLLKEIDLEGAKKEMFDGAPINRTENRAVLHVALRNRSNSPVILDSKDIMPE
ncbi:MAG: glucose-6-phosphate isomerase, partial [Cyclobacteriaceae bacterium]